GLGLPEDRIDWAAEQALVIGRLIKNNPRSFYAAAMLGLVRAAYDGDLAASARSVRPTPVEPVKESFRTHGSASMAAMTGP
ncbi:hypothetical protein AB9F45_38450, partial [Rhizobium leguminosarum]